MEGPSLVILREEAQKFLGQTVRACTGSTKQIDCEQLIGKKLTSLRTWGKHFLLCFSAFKVRVHFLMYGSYRIDEPRKDKMPRLCLNFRNGAVYLYWCSLQPLTAALSSLYDGRVDLMPRAWDENRG